MVESEYEIRTDLPSVRARRFEFDEQDLFPALTYHWSTRPGELDEAELSTFRHTFFAFFFLLGVDGSVFWLGFRCTPECLPFTVLLDHEALLFLLLELEKHILPSNMEMDFSLSDIDPCLGRP